LWEAKESCDFSSVPKAGELTGDARPRWMDLAALVDGAAPPDGAPVYMISPGAQVFTQICANCHGPEADSAGRLAATIADITAGKTRVANLRDGIFGPLDMPGANRERVFSPAASDGATAEDWAARYLVFMGLGGTTVTIPQPALDTIRNGTVLGVKRANPGRLIISDANMLAVPKALCNAVLPATISSFVPALGDLDFSPNAPEQSSLIAKNGDAELWRSLCSIDNEPVPVRTISADWDSAMANPLKYKIQAPLEGSLRRPASYPSGAPVGNPRGQVEIGIQPGNSAPWCLIRPGDDALRERVQQEWQAHAGTGTEPPYCPDEYLADSQNWFTAADAERWTTRGAMNAGLSVFLYLDALAKGEKRRPVPYNRCEQHTP
jgi:mono/diheme cytochrome c family protein